MSAYKDPYLELERTIFEADWWDSKIKKSLDDHDQRERKLGFVAISLSVVICAVAIFSPKASLVSAIPAIAGCFIASEWINRKFKKTYFHAVEERKYYFNKMLELSKKT